MFDTFYPPLPPAPGTSMTPAIKLLVAEFGDSYEQTTPDGINHIRDKISLRWEDVHPADAIEIETFLRAKQGYLPFYYTPSDDLSPILWTCKVWSYSRNRSGFRTLSAEFVQSFTPDV